jgi:CAAX protease family protein
MNENLTAVDRQRADAGPPDATAPDLPRPWGFWSTLLWGVLAFGLWGALVAGAIIWLNWGQIANLPDTQEDPWFPLQLTVANAMQIAMLAGAARLAGWPVGRYLGLVRPRARDLVAGVVAIAVLIVGLEILTHVLHRESVTPFQTDAYRVARAAGLLPLLWVAFVIAAPVAEELFFRGFLFRGWAASPLGVPGTILLTSCIFSASHVQYDWFGIFQTFCISMLFGWLRWRSGSTTLTILMHMAINFIATLWAAAKVEGVV